MTEGNVGTSRFSKISSISSSSFYPQVYCMVSNYRYFFQMLHMKKRQQHSVSLLFKRYHVKDLSYCTTRSLKRQQYLLHGVFFIFKRQKSKKSFFNQQIHPYCSVISFPTFARLIPAPAHTKKKQRKKWCRNGWLNIHEQKKNKINLYSIKKVSHMIWK